MAIFSRLKAAWHSDIDGRRWKIFEPMPRSHSPFGRQRAEPIWVEKFVPDEVGVAAQRVTVVHARPVSVQLVAQGRVVDAEVAGPFARFEPCP